MTYNQTLLIYPDTNVYARPFVDQTQPIIQAEADAFLTIIDAIKAQKLQILKSDMLLFEVYNILSEEKRSKVLEYVKFCTHHIESSGKVLELGKQIQQQCSLRARDALHIASAMLGNARYFLSCDSFVTSMEHARCYRRLGKSFKHTYFSVMNPIRFIERLTKGEIE